MTGLGDALDLSLEVGELVQLVVGGGMIQVGSDKSYIEYVGGQPLSIPGHGNVRGSFSH